MAGSRRTLRRGKRVDKMCIRDRADMMLSDDPEAEEEDDLFVLTSDSVDPADVLVPALILQVQMT